MNRKIIVLIIVSLLSIMISGCGEAKIDATSDETLKTSIAKVKDGMSSEKRVEFEKAIGIVALSDVTNIFSMATDPEGIIRRAKDKMHGKTAEQIIADSKVIQNKRRIEREKSEVIQVEARRESAIEEIDRIDEEISAIRNKIANAKNMEIGLKDFIVLSARFYFQKDNYRDKPVIEIAVRNDTKYSVSSVSFNGVLSSDGRSVPWLSKEFSYKIPGGIEPNEELTWSLAPNPYSEWGSAPKDKDDMIFTATVVSIDGTDGETIFRIANTKRDQDELDRLNKKIIDLEKIIKG